MGLLPLDSLVIGIYAPTELAKDSQLMATYVTFSDISNTERVGFEPTNSFPSNDFESFALNHSATFPKRRLINSKLNFLIIELLPPSTLH